MRKIPTLIAGIGDWLVSLSDRSRLQLVLGFLLLLGGGSVYKLKNSIEDMQKPNKQTSPQELIEPMQKIFEQSQGSREAFQHRQQTDMRQLDSLAKLHSATKALSK